LARRRPDATTRRPRISGGRTVGHDGRAEPHRRARLSLHRRALREQHAAQR
jgi:hypothetical protein